MKRGQPLKRTPLARGSSQLKRSSMPRENRARQKERKAKQEGPQAALCRTLCCCLCGTPPTPEVPTHAHHVRSRGAGGTDQDCVPLDWMCHGRLHTEGRRALGDIDLEAIAAELHERILDEAQSLEDLMDEVGP